MVYAAGRYSYSDNRHGFRDRGSYLFRTGVHPGAPPTPGGGYRYGPDYRGFRFRQRLIRLARQRLIDYKLGLTLLIATLPLALLGTLAAGWVPPTVLKVILGMGLFAVAVSLLRSPEHKDIRRMNAAIQQEYGGSKATRVLVTAGGENIRYHVCNRAEGMIIGGIGGNQRFMVAITALSASVGHFVRFTRSGWEVLSTVFSLVIFTVPGVIIGAQLGALAASRIPQRILERSLSILFILVALLTLGEVVL